MRTKPGTNHARNRCNRLTSALAGTLVMVLLGFAPSLIAVSTQLDGFRIDSVESEVDFVTGIRNYRGKVKVSHQNLRLRSDALTEFRRDGKVVRVVATGAPVRFEQLAPYSLTVHKATASKAEYNPRTGELRLWDYTVHDLDGNRTRGQRGIYRFALE